MRGRARVRHKGRQRERERDRKRNTKLATEKVYSRRAGRPAKSSTSFPARSLRLPEEAVERKRRKETEEETKAGNGGEREKEKREALVTVRARLSSLSTPARASLPAFVFLVIVAVPSGGRLWLASRREKDGRAKDRETGGETGGQGRTVG